MSALFLAKGTGGFDRLYRRHAASVYRYVYAVLGNHADAEDVTQQAFIRAYRAIAQGTKPRKAENWLLTIAHNEVRRHFRKSQVRPSEVELDERFEHPAPEPPDPDPSLADVLRALQHLPPTQRSALVMREFEGRSYAEMAEILGVTQGALEGLIFRARRSLAEQLEEGLTCVGAEEAVLHKLDRRLPRREARRLKTHLRECPSCVRFAALQKRQRAALKGLSVLPIPASLFLFRGEQAAVAAGFGAGAATAGGSAVGFAGAGGTGIAAGVAAKAAAVAATAAVAGGVGYGVATGPEPVGKVEPKTAHAATLAPTSRSTRVVAVEVEQALPRGERSVPARAAESRSPQRAAKQAGPPRGGPNVRAGNANKMAKKAKKVVGVPPSTEAGAARAGHPPRRASRPTAAGDRPQPAGPKKAKPKLSEPQPQRPMRQPQRPKPPRAGGPPPPTTPQSPPLGPPTHTPPWPPPGLPTDTPGVNRRSSARG